MAERQLPWDSAEDFILSRRNSHLNLTHEAMQELVDSIQSLSGQSVVLPPIYQVKDANGKAIAFPITMEIKVLRGQDEDFDDFAEDDQSCG